MKSIPFLSQFLVLLLVVLGSTCGFHSGIRSLSGLEPFGDQLALAYVMNFGLAAAIVTGLYLVRHRARTLIGFLFIGGSLLKFLAFFLLLYPAYQADGSMDRTEFITFFAPYSLALVLETIFAARMLRQMEREEASPPPPPAR